MLEPDKTVRFVAKGTIKTEKAGPLNILTISGIEAGASADQLTPVDDRRTSVYTVRGTKLILASNFDEERDNERPGVESYERAEGGKETASASSDAEGKLVGKWKMEMTMGDTNLDYDLRIEKVGDKLQATVISPRSGEHKAKSTTLKDNELVFEVDREIEGNSITIVYKAKLMGDELSGTASAKGLEDQFSGTFKAKK
jgi:hypothetical protein